MIDDETRRKLRELNMGEMVDALDMQDADLSCMSVPFDERVRMMVDYAWEEKRAASVKRLIGRARLRFPDAEMGEFIYDGRGVDGVLIREAGTCQFMSQAANVVIEGCTGTGKSYLVSICPFEHHLLSRFGTGCIAIQHRLRRPSAPQPRIGAKRS